jgi:hypothetical protein
VEATYAGLITAFSAAGFFTTGFGLATTTCGSGYITTSGLGF